MTNAYNALPASFKSATSSNLTELTETLRESQRQFLLEAAVARRQKASEELMRLFGTDNLYEARRNDEIKFG